jgi:hypothetical protein
MEIFLLRADAVEACARMWLSPAGLWPRRASPLSQAAGAAQLLDHVEVMTLVMATDMAIAMGAWMAYRRHGWRDIAEMTAAMYLPFIIFFPATLAGLMTGGAMMAAGHVLMLAAAGRDVVAA